MNHYDYHIVGVGPFDTVFTEQMAKVGKMCLVADERLRFGRIQVLRHGSGHCSGIGTS